MVKGDRNGDGEQYDDEDDALLEMALAMVMVMALGEYKGS